MTAIETITTRRLRMRAWEAGDRETFALLNADPVAMEHFAATLNRSHSDALADRLDAHIRQHGWGMWALEDTGMGQFIGFTGLSRPSFEAHFRPAVEIGWRLARSAWGQGYATEAARAALGFGFAQLELREIVSFTTARNARSRRVMERLGMTRDPRDDFEHPAIAGDSPQRYHVLYRLSRQEYIKSLSGGAQPHSRHFGITTSSRRGAAPRP